MFQQLTLEMRMPQSCIPVNKTDINISHCLLYLFNEHQYSYRISARHCFKCFTNTNSFIPLNNLVR